MLSEKKQVIYSNIQKSYSHSPLLSVKKKLLENDSLNVSENIRMGSPIDSKNVKNNNPIKELKKLENELSRLREENELIKFNNIQYCRQINEYEQEKLKNFQKLDVDQTEILNLNESNKTKNLLGKLSNHCNHLEREQKNLIAYLNFVTVDFLKVREKVKEAEDIILCLQKTGENKIEDVIKKMNDLCKLKKIYPFNFRAFKAMKNDDLHKVIIKVQKDKNIVEEKNDNMNKKLNDLSDNFHRLTLKYDDLAKKHKILNEEYDDRKSKDSLLIYELDAKNNLLSEELKQLQSKHFITNRAQEESRMKLVELESENQNLKSTFASTFFSSPKETKNSYKMRAAKKSKSITKSSGKK